MDSGPLMMVTDAVLVEVEVELAAAAASCSSALTWRRSLFCVILLLETDRSTHLVPGMLTW